MLVFRLGGSGWNGWRGLDDCPYLAPGGSRRWLVFSFYGSRWSVFPLGHRRRWGSLALDGRSRLHFALDGSRRWFIFPISHYEPSRT